MAGISFGRTWFAPWSLVAPVFVSSVLSPRSLSAQTDSRQDASAAPLVFTAKARTDQPTKTSPEQLRAARQELAEGLKLAGSQRCEEALAKLESANRVDPKASTLQRIARCQRAIGGYAEAVRSYQTLLSAYEKRLSPQDKSAAESELADARLKVGTIKLNLTPVDATVTLDETVLPAGDHGSPRPTAIGKHRLLVDKIGFEPFETEIEVQGGMESVVDVNLEADVRTGRVHVEDVDAAPGSRVFINGQEMGPAPWDGELEPGPYRIELRGRGSTGVKDVTVARKSILDVMLSASSAETPATHRNGRISVRTSPPNAAVRLDGQPADSPLDTELAEGRHTVEISAVGYAPETKTFDVEAGTPIVTTIVLAPTEAPAPAIRAGVFIGVISVPRPLELEAAFKLDDLIGFGAQWSSLPEVSLPAYDGKVSMQALQGIVRWYPGASSFYLGVGFGMQQVKASMVASNIAGHDITATGSAEMTNFLISPQIGWHWMLRCGVSFGVGLGVQIPLASDPPVHIHLTGSPAMMSASGSSVLLPDVANQVTDLRNQVQTAGRIIARFPLPNLDLFKVGFFF